MTDSRPKVLVVDDDPNLTELLVDTLEVIGYQATPALSPVEALRMLAETTFNLVITDISMPGMTGIELLQRIKQDSADMPVMLITGVGTDELRQQAFDSGADGFLAKPFRIGMIESEIGKLLRGIQRRRVLLVDDQPDFLNSSKERLEADNNAVSTAKNYTEALEFLQTREFDLVITDLRLPDGNGIELYRCAKRLNPDMPVILVTAYITPEVLAEIKSSGITRFMSKPIDFELIETAFGSLQPVA